MKKIFKLSIMSIALAGVVTSCDMDAPTQSTLDETSVFSQYSLAESEIMSIHVSFCQTNSYRGRFLPYYGLNSDLETGSGTQPSYSKAMSYDDKNSLWAYNTLATNGQMNTDNNAYAMFYEGIERANLAIQGIRKYGNIENNRDMAQLLGEALTLRALIYNDLIKAWGDVPARLQPNNADNVYMPRCNRDSIYKVLLADLKEAEDYCYWPNENVITKSTERVSKSFVKGLRARIALYAGGYGLRGDGYRKSKDPELASDKMYAIAKQECIDIINKHCNTLGSFEENFKKLCQDNVAAGGESLWEIPFSSGRGRVVYTFGIKHQAADQYTSQAQGGANGPLPYLYYDYDKDDIRRDITCIPYEWSKELVDGKSYQQLRGINKWCFGKLRYEWMKSERALSLGKNDDGVNWQYMRLADVYLMAAEAINALDNDQQTAWNYMKPVLDRALPAAKVEALKAKYTASQEAFFNGIVEQRGFEFAGEMLRKADLVRWGIIDEKMAEAKQKLTDLSNRAGRYADLPLKLYFKNEGENIVIYGLNHGDTDAEGAALEGYSSKQWFVDSKTNTNLLTEDYINGLYVGKPSLNCLWPIWQTFIEKSNGLLNNDGNYGQLSD
ncbi:MULTISPECIES: RagB/SusD family nutrient uptake outer membrane protein [Segatella]|uniref:RagB/SusD family nutrient uptake outer membrane protein n=5 Tax=root TaxID=1 RepID=A0AAW4N512_9BACT|nr:RagB/SusD family nutrient uptake outer membrane protein [Segatella copri]MBU9909948.1 RagB/SusD family nutrient uptake outer membrane protein [Segatella copri]MBV3397703.1 RagB/SusD family nutrient uptake outer membrane protein [Segatella copri]MBV3407238.1 RagB/SusD family nutrient uptake outer membrane protein [Segatella copri]MBV3410312.1 RagB/SusD family nutrient uptake outer membrane protein [Segatella copri]MBV3418631.1 RagB/SusD family nutrient uptake outer membrane protein [Segatell